jgi:hypothetical protein
MIKLRFNWMDVFSAARLGFNGKKIQIGTIGVMLAAIAYSIVTYVALVASKWGWLEIWRTFKYIPIPYPFHPIHFSIWGWVIWIIGLLITFFILTLTMTALCKTTYEQLKGDEFFEVKEAFKYAFKYWKGSFLAPITLLIFIAVIVFAGMVCGFVGRIPHAGQVILCLFLPFFFAGALFVVYLGVIFIVSLFISPAVVATTKSDTFDTLFENFSIINSQTWRFILWEVICKGTTAVGAFIFGLFLKKSLQVMHIVIGFWQGPRRWLEVMWNNGRWYLPPVPAFPFPQIDDFVARYVPVMFQSHTFTTGDVATTIGGFLLGLFFYLLAFIVIGFGIAMWSAGQTVIYVVLVKMKDEKNLLEQKEELFEEDFEEEPEVTVEKPSKEEKPPEGEKTKGK